MPINSDDLFVLARRLSTCADEASKRASISRAYYASYHRCIEWEKQLPAIGSDKGIFGAHACLIHRLRCPNKSCSPSDAQRSISIGKRLDRMRKRRAFADYDIEFAVPQELVEAELAMSETLLDECGGSPALEMQRRRTRRRMSTLATASQATHDRGMPPTRNC